MKKFLTYGVVIATIIWSLGIGAIVPMAASAAYSPAAGDIIKVATNPAVYYINSSLQRQLFSNRVTYGSWFNDFSGLKTIDQADFNNINSGTNVTVRPGTSLVKIDNGGAVYAVTPGAILLPIQSGDAAKALYGADWAKKIVIVQVAFESNYTKDASKMLTTTSKLPDGSVIKYAGSDSVYYIENGTKRLVTSDGFVANKLSDKFVVTNVPTTMTYADGASVTAKEDAIAGISATAVVPVETGSVSISLASDNPAAATYPLSTVAVPLLKVNVTAGSADASVSGFTVKRTGLGTNADFAKVWVEVDGARKGSQRSVSSDNTASLTFGTSPVTISAGQTKTFVFYANLGTTSGVANSLQLSAITSGGTASGLPVTGNLMQTASANAPTVLYDDVTVASAVSIGDQDISVGKIKITNNMSGEDVAVKGITFKSIAPTSGTRVDTNDVINFELYKGTAKVAGPVQMSADSYVKFVLDSEVLIEKGGTKNETFTVKADVAEGPGRIIKLDIEYTSDVVVVGKGNGFRATPTSSTYAAQEITIGATDLAISTDAINNPASRNVLKNTNQTLLKGYIDASKGEVDVTSFRVTLTGNDMDFGTTNEYDNLRVYVGGVLVGEATGDDISTSDNQTAINVAFTDDFSVSGKKSLEVTMDVKEVTDTDWIYASIAGSAGWTATRVSDGAAVTPGGSVTGNKVSINASTLTLALAATPASATRVKGATNVDLVGFTMASGVTDAVTVNSLTFAIDSTGDIEDDSDLTNVYLYKQGVATAVAGPVNLNSAEQIVFTGLNITVAAGNTDKYFLKGSISASTNDASLADLWVKASDIDASTSQGNDIASVTGVDSGPINAAGTIKLTLVDRGTLDVGLNSGTPDSKMVIANTTGNVSAKITLYAQYEAVSVKKLTLTTVGTTANDDDIKKVTLKNGTTVIGEAPSVSSGAVTFNLATPLVVPADGSVTLDVVTDYETTVNSVADSGATIQWSIANYKTDIEADGQIKDVWAAIRTYNGTGVTLTVAGSDVTTLAEDVAADETAIDVTSATNINEGDLLLLDDGNNGAFDAGADDLVLVLSKSGNTLTVRRGIGGLTANTITTGDGIRIITQVLKANTDVLYSNIPSLGYVAADQASGSLTPGTKEILKFTLSDSVNGEEDISIEELLVRIDGSGMAASNGDGWYISSASLYKDGKLVGTDANGLESASGDLAFTALDADADSVIGIGSVFTVVATVAEGTGGTITAGDTLQATINNFGSADSAGSITGGDLDWEDGEAPTAQIEWIQTNLTEVKGGLYQKLT
jgi:hypothetical protein